MKLQHLFTVAVIVAFSGPAPAGDLTIPNTFVSGDPARAAEVNANFSAVKTEVDDNDARIILNEAAIANRQSRVTGSCAAGQSIRVINADGSVDCVPTQDRVSETCPVGESIRAINPDGSVICEVDTDTDTDTQYIAGEGLSLDNVTGEFSINPAETQRRGVDMTCAGAGDASIQSIDVNGNVICETDDNTTYTAGTGMQLDVDEFRPADGWVSVPPSAFVATTGSSTISSPANTGNDNNPFLANHTHSMGHSVFIPQNCQLSVQPAAVNFIDTNSTLNCDAFAPLHLPHGATLTELRCKVHDSGLGGFVNELTAQLHRVPVTGEIDAPEELVFATFNSDNRGFQELFDTDGPENATQVVNNEIYSYQLFMNWSTTNFTNSNIIDSKIIGCKVGFIYP